MDGTTPMDGRLSPEMQWGTFTSGSSRPGFSLSGRYIRARASGRSFVIHNPVLEGGVRLLLFLSVVPVVAIAVVCSYSSLHCLWFLYSREVLRSAMADTACLTRGVKQRHRRVVAHGRTLWQTGELNGARVKYRGHRTVATRP